jgi:hypothetical protein
MVFGKGYLTWEWTFKDPIRNPLFPLLYAIPYYLLKVLNLDSNLAFFSLVPKLTQAFVGAAFDVMLLKINAHYQG